MSDLSILIESQNEVPIDEDYLEECRQTSLSQQRRPPAISRAASFKELRLNRNKNLVAAKRKTNSPLSSDSPPVPVDSKLLLARVEERVRSLAESQQEMERRIGYELFQLKDELGRQKRGQEQQRQEARRIKEQVAETKQKVAALLGMISKAQY
jgi:hypothetical protein